MCSEGCLEGVGKYDIEGQLPDYYHRATTQHAEPKNVKNQNKNV